MHICIYLLTYKPNKKTRAKASCLATFITLAIWYFDFIKL